MTDIQTRLAQLQDPEDAAAFVSLLNEYAQEPGGGGAAISAEVQRILPARAQQESNFGVLLAERDGAPVGLLTFIRGFSTFSAAPSLNIHDLMVTRSARRSGVGTALLQAIARLAQQQGCCKLTLEVLSSNESAQALYRSEGFSDGMLPPATGQPLFWQKKL